MGTVFGTPFALPEPWMIANIDGRRRDAANGPVMRGQGWREIKSTASGSASKIEGVKTVWGRA